MSDNRVKTGVDGLDEMLQGGFPENHIVVLMGSFGTGKTTFGLQYLIEGLKNGESCMFISLEEDRESITKNAASYGWDLEKAIETKKLGLFKLEPSDAKTTVTRIKSDLPKFIKTFGAKRVVIDSVSLLNMMFTDDTERRSNLFNLCQLLRSTGATALLTAEVRDDNPRSSRDGLAEYTADGVVLLQSDENRDGGEVQLTIRVLKMRRTSHSRRVKPYSISDKGITVHAGADVF
ncbi:MAG: KaiC domain-containing protein [Thermoplasmata archaeon]|nr:KaiC domain-containing protein [Thermoplasmata archaeon]MCJ7562383.1 KaiC domain-containing protein [Thermoplasmata archaeon]TFG69926.1 MAG: KaiC domain-containing protein [Methanomassiliicoccus sp.]